MTRSLANLRLDLLDIVRAGIAAVDAGLLLDRALTSDVSPAFTESSLGVQLIAAGKAAPAMATAALRLLGFRIRGGLVVAPFPAAVSAPFETIVGGHPVPTAGSEEAGRRALALARCLTANDMLLVLLSGGASAVMAVPADGVSLEDKRKATDLLLRAGADIHALNTVRKHLSAIKGGRLAAATAGASLTLAISDVVGDDLSVIGSGPTVADASTFSAALAELGRFGGSDAYPRSVVARLTSGERGQASETPKPGDARLSRATAKVIGGRHDAMSGAEEAAERRGYRVLRLDDPIVGEARIAAISHVRAVLGRASALERPACVIASGETTVHVRGPGRGGRNQEFALAAAGALASGPVIAALASVGTDGIDGPTDAAGAISDSTTIDRARSAGLHGPAQYLDNNDAHAFFSALGDLIHTGPTGTNVGDLQVMLLA